MAEYYHANESRARTAADELAKDPRVARALWQFVPYNGWVVVLVPRRMDLSDLADQAEIQDGTYRKPPVEKKRPIPVRDSAVGGATRAGGGGGGAQPGSPPTKGATAKVWEIADGVGKADRAAIIAACVAAGINIATAGTQYSKWKKARGL